LIIFDLKLPISTMKSLCAAKFANEQNGNPMNLLEPNAFEEDLINWCDAHRQVRRGYWLVAMMV
jgi:hypothetical protein